MELIVDEQDWVPGVIFPTTERVLLRIGYGETELREAVKVGGGIWDPGKKGWVLPWRKAVELGLELRIIGKPQDFLFLHLETWYPYLQTRRPYLETVSRCRSAV